MARKPGDGMCKNCGDKPVHVYKSGVRDGCCYDCMRARRRKTEAEREKRGCDRVAIEDEFLTLAAFPEPAKFLKMVRDISETVHVDKRTIAHRSSKAVAGSLGRAQLAGD